MYSMWIHFSWYDFGQMAIILVALSVLIYYLLKLTRVNQVEAKLSNMLASFYQMMRNVNSKTLLHRYKSTPETTNLARVARLILGPCTDLLRDILKRKIPPSNLSKTVKIWIDDLKKKKLKNPLNKQQISLIFPLPTKQYGGNFSDFDISLMYILLRNVCKISPHNKGWGEEPDLTDNSISANIERIRLTRNKYYGHAADFSLSESNFIKEWQNIYNITVMIEQYIGTSTVYQDAVNDIRTCSMDPEIEAKYIDKLLLIDELCETVKSHTDEIKKLQQEILPNVKDEIKKLQHVIPRNVKDLHEKQLRQWREEDGVYSEIHTFKIMLNKVRTQPYMTFVGVPGSGKSATIHHIALILQKEGVEVVPIIDISEVHRYCDSHNPQVFVIDDVVGVLGLQKQKLETLVDYEKIISNHSRHTKVLMSCREAVFNECYKSFFKNEKNVIKLCSPENALNDDDKKAILQTHGLDKELLSPTLLREASTMFPLLCKLISKEANFKNNIERFFTCPTECILNEFDKMQEQNRLQYATLVLCLLNDNKLSKEILKDTENKTFSEMKSKALENCEVESYTDSFKFVKALSVMEGTYTKLCGSEYTFIHDSIFENIAYHFGSQFPNLILQFMSSTYIANYVKLQKNEMLKSENEKRQAMENVVVKRDVKNEINTACEGSQNDDEALSPINSDSMESCDLCIRLGKKHYSMLAERLYRDIENMELYDVFMNNVLKHPSVCQAFIEVLKTNSYTELKSLFLSEQKDVSKVVFERECGREEIEEGYMEWCRQGVLVNEEEYCDIDNITTEKTYSVRVISWVVYYGHNQILQYILEQTDLHKETQSEFFWNSFTLDLTQTTKQGEKHIAANNPIANLRSFRELDIDGSIAEHQRLLLLSYYNGNLETMRIFIKYLKRNTIYLTFPNLDIKYVFGGKTLAAACEGGHLSVVKELLEAGADVNPQGVYYTPLTAACKGGYISIVKELLGAGADVNLPGEYDTPLAAACQGGYTSIVKELLRAGAYVNQENDFNIHIHNKPLTAACQCGYTSIVKELLRAGANINPEGCKMLDTPLIGACKSGHLNIVKELIMAGAVVNLKSYTDTPLTAACTEGHFKLVRELIVAGAVVNLKGRYDTPLTAACKGGHLNIVRELLEARADVNLQFEYHTALTAACRVGYTNLVDQLLEAGADVNPHGYIYTPLTAAVKGGNMIIFKKMLSACADVNPQNKIVSPLIAACEDGHESFVKELLDAGANVNLQSLCETPLIAACYGGHMRTVMELLKAGANVNLQIESCTPLIAAFWGGHEDIVKELIKAGANVNFLGKYYKRIRESSGRVNYSSRISYSPLTLACNGRYLSGVKALLKAGAKVNLRGEYLTPLMAAIESGCMSITKEILGAGGDVNKEVEYQTPLIAASIDIDIVKELLKAGANVNQQGQFETPLTEACKHGNLSIVIELLNAGADVSLQGKHGKRDTPLMAACSYGHRNIVMELLKAGTDVNLQVEHDTPLIAACKKGCRNIVKELIKAGADVNLQGKYETPLTQAIKHEHSSIVTELIKAGADVNLQGKYETPLTQAIKHEHSSIVTELIKAGADVNLQRYDYTPLTLAIKYEYSSIVTELINTGADVNLQGKNETPLTQACKSGLINIVIDLLKAGADVNLQGEYHTPLTAACKGGHVIIAKNLLDTGSDINMQDKEGNIPLYTVFKNINKAFSPVILRMFYIYGADSTISNRKGISTFYFALIRNEIELVKQLLRIENESQSNKLKLHLFDCLVDIRHSDVMTDSKDDMMVTRRRVWRMEREGDLYDMVLKSDCTGLKHLVCVGLDVNQWIQLYADYNKYDVKPLLFTMIDESYYDDKLENKVQILLESGADVNVRVRYRECDSVLDREGVSVLERTGRLLSEYSKNKWKRYELLKYTRVIKKVKKHVRRYSV